MLNSSNFIFVLLFLVHLVFGHFMSSCLLLFCFLFRLLFVLSCFTPLISSSCSSSCHSLFTSSSPCFVLCLSSKKKRCVIYGKWTECMWSVDPQAYETHKKSEKKDNKKQKNVRTSSNTWESTAKTEFFQ